MTDEIEWHRFEMENHAVHIAFTETQSIKFGFPPGSAVFDIFGKEIIGKTLELNPNPIYLFTTKNEHPEQYLRTKVI